MFYYQPPWNFKALLVFYFTTHVSAKQQQKPTRHTLAVIVNSVLLEYSANTAGILEN